MIAMLMSTTITITTTLTKTKVIKMIVKKCDNNKNNDNKIAIMKITTIKKTITMMKIMAIKQH